jgi:hypothetical protein
MKIRNLALAMWLAGAAARASEPPQKLAVYVEVQTPDRLTIVPLAKHWAGKMFAEIGVVVEWTGSRGADDSAEPIVIEIVSNTPREIRPESLGYSVLHTSNRITVFLDRVELLSYPAIVLAHVMVHEITHVLEGIGRHSETGVMRAHWRGAEYCEMRRKPLPFAPEDVHLIHEGLARRQSTAGTLEASR